MVRSSLRTTRAARLLRTLVALLSVASLVGVLTVREPATLSLVTDAGGRTSQLSPDPDEGVPQEPAPAGGTVSAPMAPADVVAMAPIGTDAASPGSTPGKPRPAASASAPTTRPAASVATTAIDTGLWVAEGQGAFRRLSPEAGWKPLAWSPARDEVAVARGDGVSVFNPSSGSRRQVLSRPGMTVMRGAWSPDGRSIAVQLSDPSAFRPRLYVVEVGSGAATELPHLNHMSNLAYTPNGCLAVADTVDGLTGLALHCPGQAYRLVPLSIGTLAGGMGSAGLAYTDIGAAGIRIADVNGSPVGSIAGQNHLYGEDLAWDQAHGILVWRGSHDGNTHRVELYASQPGGTTTTITRCSSSAPTASANGTLVYGDCDRAGQSVLQRRPGPTGPPQAVATIPYSRAATPLLSSDSRWLIAAVSPF